MHFQFLPFKQRFYILVFKRGFTSFNLIIISICHCISFSLYSNIILIILSSNLLIMVYTLCIFIIYFQIRTLTMGKYQTCLVYASIGTKCYWYLKCRKRIINLILLVHHRYSYVVTRLYLRSICIPVFNFAYPHNFNANQTKLHSIFTTGVRLDILLSVCMVYTVSCYNVAERDSKCKLYEYAMVVSYRKIQWP